MKKSARFVAKIVRKAKGTGQKIRRAQILQEADGSAWTDAQIAETFSCRPKTIENIRQGFVERDFQDTLDRKPALGAGANKLLNGREKAQIIAMQPGSPPEGYGKWTLRLLPRKVVELQVAPQISHETVRQTLKKNRMATKDSIEYWVIPPECDAEFTANLKNVLETYEKPYDPSHPVICMDEQPVQLIKETRVPIATHKKDVTSINFVGASDEILTSYADNEVRLHRAANGGDVRSFAGATGLMFSAAASDDGKAIVAGGQGGVLRVWEGTKGTLGISSIPKHESRRLKRSIKTN